VLGAVFSQFRQESMVLSPVILPFTAVTVPQVDPIFRGVGCRPGNSVEFVIAHRRPGGARIDHPADNVESTKLAGTTIDKITDEYDASAGMSPGASAVLIAKFA
jgi:hypothetical protein